MRIVSIETAGKSESLEFGPGKVFKQVIQLITGETPNSKCKCLARARQMNKWGWVGCWANRETITDWLCEEAERRGHRIDRNRAMSLLIAALREIAAGKNS